MSACYIHAYVFIHGNMTCAHCWRVEKLRVIGVGVKDCGMILFGSVVR